MAKSNGDEIRVFLSYRRADTQHVAGRFADKLGDRFAVFMDIDTIPPGVDFTDYVRRAVGNCDVLLAFIGTEWAASTDESGRRRLHDPADWVAEEIRTALQREVRVIPVLVDGAALPDLTDLPSSLQPLTQRQALPLRHASFSADAARLITAIQAAAAADPTAEPYAARWEVQPPPPPVQVTLAPTTRRRRSRGPVIAAGIAVLTAIAVTVGLLLIKPFPTSSASPTAPSTAAHDLPPSQRPRPSASRPAPAPVRTVSELRAHIPAALAASCRKLEPEAEVLRASLQVAVQCLPTPGSRMPRYQFYFAYADLASAERAFRTYYGTATLPSGTCQASDAEGQYDSQGGQPASGTLRCYTDADGVGVFAWTNDHLAIVASIADPALGTAEMKQFWELAGPLEPGR